LEFKWSVAGFVHRLNTYMAYNDVLGQHQMVDRDGITTILWTVGAQYFWDKIRAIYDTSGVASPASVTLFSRSGTLWNLIDVANLTGAGLHAPPYTPAQQWTWVLRDTAFFKLRFVLLETYNGYAAHFNDGITTTAINDAITNALNGVDVSANAPFRWMKSRGNRFLAASGTVAGLTADLNDKLKRARGLA
jgi:hypothetical protein